jgi:phage gpG-like protein
MQLGGERRRGYRDSGRLALGRAATTVDYAGARLGQGSADGRRSVVSGLTALHVRANESRSAVALRILLLLLLGAVLWRGFASEPHVASRAARPAAAHHRAQPHRGLSSLPLAAQGVVSATLGSDSSAYRISRLGGEYQAVNPAQHLRARFGGGGVRVQSGALRLGMRLDALGYGGSLTAVASVAPRARGNRVVYPRAGLSEWYTNGPLGIEQGFTILRRPVRAAAGPLILSLALSGDTRFSVSANARSLAFAAPGSSSLRYDDLVASDARGRDLRSWITLQGRRALLHIDTRAARYPLRIDPLIQQGSKLTGKEETGAGEFGSVALSGDGNTALVGGPGDNTRVGAAWVFTRSEGKWTQQGTKITGKEETGSAEFGTSVALSSNGNTALIGGQTDDGSVGAAWVFTRSEGKWTQQGTKITGKEETGVGGFGSSVALSSEGNTALIGGDTDDGLVGAAWVFTRSEGKWTQQSTKITGKEETGKGFFGSSVALSSNGNTALIGGYFDDEGIGAAWVFTRSEGKWTQQGAKITGKEEIKDGDFGTAVALSSEGNTALIGGLTDNKFAGAAWVFTRAEGKWTQQAKLTGKEETGEGFFGSSVALSSEGSTALIGGWKDNKEVGAAWVFTRAEGKWAQQGAKLTGEEETGDARFGSSVALSADGSTALIGGPLDNKSVGAAWAFTVTGSKLTGGSEETGAGYFGYRVALSANGNTALIGAPKDDKDLGAAWVFTYSEGKWTQQGAKITGKEETGEGEFGDSVALSSEGNTALMGGQKDDQTESGPMGAAWVFTRAEGKWTQQGTKLTGKEGVGGEEFGSSVALSSEGNTALIGGDFDNSAHGAAWVFTRSEGKWTQQGAKITGKEETGSIILFGCSVALSANGSTALIAGYGDNEDIGAAWVFTRSEGKWTQQGAKITGKEETGKGLFGTGVALGSEGNTALIGGSGDNKTVGAAWVYTRSEGKWTQQGTKITGNEETGAGAFGESVALSSNGNTALVGGLLNNESRGAAWLFTRSEGQWTPGARLTGNEETGGGGFGSGVALSSEGNAALTGGENDNSGVGAGWAFVP